MRRVILTTILTLLVCCQYAMAETYDIEKYLSAVSLYSKDLRLAGKEKEMAEAQRRQAISAALPSVGLQAGYTRNLSDYYMYFDMAALDPDATGVAKAPIKKDNEYSATVALKQTIFNPTVASAIKAAGQYTRVTDYVYEASGQAVRVAAKKLFYRCLLLGRVYDVAVASEDNARDNYNIMQKKYDNGQVSQFDLLQAETRWRSAVPETDRALRNYRLAMNMLKNMAGIETEHEIELRGSLNEVPALPEKTSLETILAARPDFQALLWQEKLRKTAVSAARWSFLPVLSGTVAYSYSAQSDEFNLEEENNYWFAGVELSLPIFTGGYRMAEVQKAKIELAKTRIGIDKTRESIANEISNVYLRLEEAHERIESARATLRVAEQAFRIAETTTRDGLSTQLELKDARVGYDGAQLNYFAAIYDYLEAYFDWELLNGAVD